MKKDVGRRKNIHTFATKINGKYFDGTDNTKLDNNGLISSWDNTANSTKAITTTHINLLNYFTKHNKEEYLIIFEDDIHIRNSRNS